MRLIDADAFKDYIRGACEDMKHLYKDNGAWAKEITESFCKDIDEQPTVSAEPHWIPCSERLPEKGEYGKVLVTYIPSGGTLWTTVIIAHYSDLMGIAKPSFHIGNVGKNDFINITEQVTAWMPLPEPWREAYDETD